MIGLIIFFIILLLPAVIMFFVLAAQLKQEEKQKNIRMNKTRYIKTEYELDAFNFIKEETIRLENEHKKKKLKR